MRDERSPLRKHKTWPPLRARRFPVSDDDALKALHYGWYLGWVDWERIDQEIL